MQTPQALAVQAAEQLERSVGPVAGLSAFRQLVRVPDPTLRTRALAGALRCAAAAGDELQLRQHADLWRSASPEGHLATISAICGALAKRGRPDLAIDLAGAEVDRSGSARAHYLLGRCLELVGADATPIAFQRAADAAGRGPRTDVKLWVAAKVRRTRALLAMGRIEAASAEVAALFAPPASLGPEELVLGLLDALAPADKLAVAKLRLDAASRFARAAALSMLAEVASGPDPAAARAAIRTAAAHADKLGPSLSPLEIDRLDAVLSMVPPSQGRNEARARLDGLRTICVAPPERRPEALASAVSVTPATRTLAARVRALLGGEPLSPWEPLEQSPPILLAASALLALSAMRHESSHESARRLAQLASEVRAAKSSSSAARDELGTSARRSGRGGLEALPPAVWSAATAALGSADALIKRAGVELVGVLVAVELSPPACGWSRLADLLTSAGAGELAAQVSRRALTAGEARAREALSRTLACEAWTIAEALAKDERDPHDAERAAARATARAKAIALLVEARSLVNARPALARPGSSAGKSERA